MALKESNTEQILLEAAETEFLEKGYGKARTTEIAKRAGVNHAMLHYYFRTKEHLFETVFRKKASLMSEVMFFSLRQDLSFLEKIKKRVEDHFDFIAANSRLPNFMFSEVLYDEKLKSLLIDVLREKVKSILHELKAEIDKEVKNGTIRPVNPYDLLYTIISLNIFAFMGAPAITGILNLGEEEYKLFLQHRKQVNVETILNQLRL